MKRALVALGIIAVLVGGAVAGGILARVDQSQDEPRAPQKAASVPEPGLQVDWADFLDETVIQIEAESYEQADGPIQTVSDAEASGSKVLTIPEGPNKTELNPPWKTAAGKPVPAKEIKNYLREDLVPNGVAVYTFQVEKEADYFIWARHYWPHSCANSFSYQIDQGQRLDFFGDTTEGVWKWGRAKKSARPVHLTAGAHKLVLMNREDGMKVDKFLLTTDGQWVPTGKEGN